MIDLSYHAHCLNYYLLPTPTMHFIVPSKACRRNGVAKSNYVEEEISISGTSFTHKPQADCDLTFPIQPDMSSTKTYSSNSTTFAKVLSSGCKLHTALELGIPDHVTMILALRHPISLCQMDERGRYPIHVACAYGASSRFVALCLRSNPSSAVVKDVDDNTPLQLLCKGTWKGDWNLKVNPSAETDMIGILEMLYLKAPSSLLFSEDSCGIGPIETAINSNLDLKFIEALQGKIAHLSKTKALTAAHRKRVAAPRTSMKFPLAANEA